MFQSVFLRKFVGITSLLSAILWTGFSIGMIIFSLTAVEGIKNSFDAQRQEIETSLVNTKTVTILGVELDTPESWKENVDGLIKKNTNLFGNIAGILDKVKLLMLILPAMIILSQVTPVVLGVQLFFWN